MAVINKLKDLSKRNCLLLLFLIGLSFALLSCDEDENGQESDVLLLYPNDQWENVVYLGDTLVSKFLVMFPVPVEIVDVNIVDSKTNESVFFESHYPDKNNTIITVTYPLPSEFEDPAVDSMFVNTFITVFAKNHSLEGMGASFKIKSR